MVCDLDLALSYTHCDKWPLHYFQFTQGKIWASFWQFWLNILIFLLGELGRDLYNVTNPYVQCDSIKLPNSFHPLWTISIYVVCCMFPLMAGWRSITVTCVVVWVFCLVYYINNTKYLDQQMLFKQTERRTNHWPLTCQQKFLWLVELSLVSWTFSG